MVLKKQFGEHVHYGLMYFVYFHHYLLQRLTYLLYKAADEYGWMNPKVVQEILGVGRQEADEYGATEKSLLLGTGKNI